MEWTGLQRREGRGKSLDKTLVYAHIKQLDRGTKSHSLFLQRKVLHNERPSTTSTRIYYTKCALMWQRTSKSNTGIRQVGSVIDLIGPKIEVALQLSKVET